MHRLAAEALPKRKPLFAIGARMRNAKLEEAATPAQEPGESAFQPRPAQRAFVSAAAGLGVPRRVICRMLPGADPGAPVSISAHMLKGNAARLGDSRIIPAHLPLSPVITPASPVISRYLPCLLIVERGHSADGDFIGF
jgi:hypothetical protein